MSGKSMEDNETNLNQISEKEEEKKEQKNESKDEGGINEFNNEIFTNNKISLSNEEELHPEENIKAQRNNTGCDEEFDELNGEEELALISNDLYKAIISKDKNDDVIVRDKDNFFFEDNNAENSDQDLMLIQEEHPDLNEYDKNFPIENDMEFNNKEEDKIGIKHKWSGDKLTSTNDYFTEDPTIAHIKKQMELNKKNVPRIPSNPTLINNMNNNYQYFFGSQGKLISNNQSIPMSASPNSNHMNMPEFVNSFNQSPINTFSLSSNNLQTLNFPNNSFTRDGKNGWVCPICGNFNYEMRIQCNRCRRAQIQTQNPMFNSYENLRQLENQNMFRQNNGKVQSKGSQFDLNNAYNNFNFVPNSQPSLMSPMKGNFMGKGRNDYRKQKKQFIEKEGDWICGKCKNLNFAFREECNRCKLPRKESALYKNNIAFGLISSSEKNNNGY